MQAMNFSMNFGSAEMQLKRSGETLKIGIIGDFSPGNTSSQWSVSKVDIDSFDDILAELSPSLELKVGPNKDLDVHLEFGEIDDFHPDNIFQQVPCFEELKNLKARLKDQASFPAAAEELRKFAPVPGPGKGTSQSSDSVPEMDKLLDKGVTAQAKTESGSVLDQIIAKAMSGHIHRDLAPQQETCLQILQDTMTARMNEILHDPQFRTLECRWREVEFLLSRLNTDDGNIKICLINVPVKECMESLQQDPDNWQSSKLNEFLKSKGSDIPGESPWGLLCMLKPFSFGDSSFHSLRAMASIAESLGACLLTGSSFQQLCFNPDSQDVKDLSETACLQQWQEFRKLPEASRVLMTMPRFILRYPYGRNFDSIDGFNYEELDPLHVRESILWGNTAIAGTLALAEAWKASGGEQIPLSGAGQVEDLPFCMVSGNSGSMAVPCGEYLIPERIYMILFDQGFSPAVSFKNQPLMRLLLHPVHRGG